MGNFALIAELLLENLYESLTNGKISKIKINLLCFGLGAQTDLDHSVDIISLKRSLGSNILNVVVWEMFG
jgi:hypothetical protein